MSEVAKIYDASDYAQRFKDKQEEIQRDVEANNRGFNERMAELVQMQQQEILRLQKVLRDNTTLPDRYPAEIAIGSAATSDGRGLKHVLFAVANDRSLWLCENYAPAAPQYAKWGRVPPLPQASDEAEQPK
jgi:hypothetical protein